MTQLELIDFDLLENVTVKQLYVGLTETLPPPKIVHKYSLPWDQVWQSINHPMLEVEQRELTFMLVHNVLPTKERLHGLNQADSSECSARDGVETIEHLFCQCQRVQVAWAWMRRKILNKNLADPRANDSELINLVNGCDNISKDFIFLIHSKLHSVCMENENMQKRLLCTS